MIYKKGTVFLRNIVFMMVVFGGIMALGALAMVDLATEYGNTNATSEFQSDGINNLGSFLLTNVSDSVLTMRNATDPSDGSKGLVGSFATFGLTALDGASTIVKTVFLAPIYISQTLATVFTSLGVPTAVSNVVGTVVTLLIYAVIIFGIITAALRGGKI